MASGRDEEPCEIRCDAAQLDIEGPSGSLHLMLDDRARVKPLNAGVELYAHSEASREMVLVLLKLGTAEASFVQQLRASGKVFLDFPQRFTLTHMLGQGGCARVYCAKHADGEAAIKVAETKIEKDLLLRESRFLHELSSDHVVKPLGLYEFSVKGNPCIALALEKMDGDLCDLIPAGGLDEASARPLMKQLVCALGDLHGQGKAHRDLKPANILYRGTSDGPLLKLCDFGLACGFDEDEQWKHACGTPGYCAPEVLRREGRADAKSDLFSLGVVFFVMLTSLLPENLHGASPKPSASDDCLQLLAGLLEPDAQQRWSAQGASRCTWLRVEAPGGCKESVRYPVADRKDPHEALLKDHSQKWAGRRTNMALVDW
jgi:serine/threonine protein kinase